MGSTLNRDGRADQSSPSGGQMKSGGQEPRSSSGMSTGGYFVTDVRAVCRLLSGRPAGGGTGSSVGSSTPGIEVVCPRRDWVGQNQRVRGDPIGRVEVERGDV